MNKKGFTLVELLAVITILALLAILTGTAVTKIVNSSKLDLSEVQIKSIQSAAELWGADNIYKLPEEGKCKYITLGDLKEYGLLDEKIIDSKNNQEIPDSLKIKITVTITAYDTIKYEYEVNPNNIKDCLYAYDDSSSGDEDPGEEPPSNPVEYVCTAPNGTDIGDIVTCGTESFYVVENNTNTLKLLTKDFVTPVSSSGNYPVQSASAEKIIFSDVINWNIASLDEVKNGYFDVNWIIKETNIYPTLTAYSSYLKEQLGLSYAETSLITFNTLRNLGCIVWSDHSPDYLECFSSGYTWLYEPEGYWTYDGYKSVTDSGESIEIGAVAELDTNNELELPGDIKHGIVFLHPLSKNYEFHIRPTVIINKSDINKEK